MPKIPKGVFNKTFQNPNSRATSNYSVVEDLSQTPCAMSALEVLQICPAQWDALLAALGSMDSLILMEKFNFSDVKILLPYHVDLSIDVIHGGKTIGRSVVDKGASTCVMSFVLLEGSSISKASPIEHPTYFFRWKVISSTWYPTIFWNKVGRESSVCWGGSDWCILVSLYTWIIHFLQCSYGKYIYILAQLSVT